MLFFRTTTIGMGRTVLKNTVSFSCSFSNGLIIRSRKGLQPGSQELVDEVAKKIERTRSLLHLRGEAIIMALTAEVNLWACGKLTLA